MDTFIHFFRAYYQNGYLVYNLTTIRKNYFRSGWFFFNLLSSIPTSFINYVVTRSTDMEVAYGNTRFDNFLLLLDAFKLLRIFRIQRLLEHSFVITTYSEKMNVKVAGELLTVSKWCFHFLSRHVVLTAFYCSHNEIYCHDFIILGEQCKRSLVVFLRTHFSSVACSSIGLHAFGALLHSQRPAFLSGTSL